ncbi:hypothetical protein [Streptomyces sp. NPDC051452]|uniref:hypothetical protein n=1 Tax=Streptomyces sp. NPDC051452 TaxID=3365654 RepID=UPI0037A05608
MRRSRLRLRALVLLLALWVPTAHVQAQVAPALWAAAENAEHEGLEAALRPPARAVHRADVPERPAPLPDPAPAPSTARPHAAALPAPHAPSLPRTVVLRC